MHYGYLFTVVLFLADSVCFVCWFILFPVPFKVERPTSIPEKSALFAVNLNGAVSTLFRGLLEHRLAKSES